MPGTVEPRIRTIAGVTSDGSTKIVTNGNPSDYLNVRLTDGSAFYVASGGSGGSGTATTVNVGSYGGTATTLGQKAMTASAPVVIASDQTVPISNAVIDNEFNAAIKDVNDTEASRFVVIGGTFADSSPILASGDPRSLSFRLSHARAMHVTLRDNTTNQLIGQKAMSGSLPVAIASDNTLTIASIPQVNVSNTVSVTGSNITIAQMPTTNVSITGQPVTTTTNINSYGGTATTLGRKAMASSIPVTIASDQGSYAVTATVTNTVTISQSIPSNFQATINVNSWGGVATSLGIKPMTASLPIVLASDHGSIDMNIGRYGGASTTLGQKAMSASIPVVFASDQSALTVTNVSNATVYQSVASNLNNRNYAAHSGVSTLTALETTFDNTISTASSDPVTCTGYRVGLFSGIASSSGTPTDMTFTAEFLAQNETDWMPYVFGPWGKFVYEDTALASGKKFAIPIPLEGNDSVRFTAVTTGVTSANKFSLTKMRFQMRT